MAASRLKQIWTLVTVVLLVAAIAIGGTALSSHFPVNQAIEIVSSPSPQSSYNVAVSGGVYQPGLYPASGETTINELLQSAGGIMEGNDSREIQMEVASESTAAAYQRININRADAWLLEALPGIGTTLAQRIVDYRTQNGLFATTAALANVNGIGLGGYEKIKDLITVVD